MRNKTLFLIAAIFLVIGFLGGNFYGSLKTKKLFEAKIKKAIEKLPDNGPLSKTPLELKAINGSIKEIKGDVLILKVPESSNPFEEWPLEREIIVNKDTKILKRVMKDFYEYEKERKNLKEEEPVPPPYKEEEIKLEELKVGDYLLIEAEKNIKFEKKIIPIKIVVL